MKLTKQEKIIAEMISRGMDNDTIANTLFIEKTTLRTHLMHLYKKYGIKRTTNTNDCRSILVAKYLHQQIIQAHNKLKVAEQMHEEALKFMQPDMNICKKFVELYQNETPCINCPVELMRVDCKKKKNICVQRIWELIE